MRAQGAPEISFLAGFIEVLVDTARPEASSPAHASTSSSTARLPVLAGVSVIARTRLTRAATITGTFTSDYHGADDTSVMEPEIVEPTRNDAVACT